MWRENAARKQFIMQIESRGEVSISPHCEL